MWLIYKQYSCPPRWRAAMHLRVTRPFAQCIQPSQKAVGAALRSYLREEPHRRLREGGGGSIGCGA